MDTTGVRAEALLLCRSLEIVDNEAYLLGGGWSTIGYNSFPGVHAFRVLARVIVPFTETNRELEFTVTLEDEDGVDILPRPFRPRVTVGRPAHLVRGEEQSVNFPLVLDNIEIPQAGTYTIRLRHEDAELARTSFSVVLVPTNIQRS